MSDSRAGRDRVLTLMENLEKSVAAAKEARDQKRRSELNPILNVGDLRKLIEGQADEVPVRVHFGWDLAIVESGFDEDDGAVLFFPDTDAGVSSVSTAWADAQGIDGVS